MTDLRARLADAIFTETASIVFTDDDLDDQAKAVFSIMSMSADRIAGKLLSLPGIAIVDSQQLVKQLDGLAAKYDENKLQDHARGVRHAGRLVVAALLAAANAAESVTK